MSALLMDDLVIDAPVRPEISRWRHVDSVRGPGFDPELTAGGRPSLSATDATTSRTASAAPGFRAATRPRPVVAPAPMRLTDRGLAVVVVFFLALVATAAVVLVTAFLAVSNDPIAAPGRTPGVSVQG